MCGIFSVFGHPQAARLTVRGLKALQHRGRDSVGLVTYDGKTFYEKKVLGRIEHYTSTELKAWDLPGDCALGHVRYGTQGYLTSHNIQPLVYHNPLGLVEYAFAHNGQFSFAQEVNGGISEEATESDTACFITRVMNYGTHETVLNRLIQGLSCVQGAYACCLLTGTRLIAARDPAGIRPLILGRLGNAFLLSSETYALDSVGATFLREIHHGEVLEVTRGGIQTFQPFKPMPLRPCLFEYIYFSHPQSRFQGRTIGEIRYDLGRHLGDQSPVSGEACVVPIPGSGCHAAQGYAHKATLPYEEAIQRHFYAGRTFLISNARKRRRVASHKYSVDSDRLRGQRVVLVDDSLVRGTTLERVVKKVREAGVQEIHVRIASPPVIYPDFYGLGLPDQKELLAVRHTERDLAKHFAVDSFSFLQIERIYQVFNTIFSENCSSIQFADHYFTGHYPDTQSSLLKHVA